MTAGAADDPALTRHAYAAQRRRAASGGLQRRLRARRRRHPGPPDPAIGARSAGSRPEPGRPARPTAAAQGLRVDAGLVPVLKHFPGPRLGHHRQPPRAAGADASRGRSCRPPTWCRSATAIAAGASTVMVGHLDVRAVDPGVPSSLSRKVVTGLLRGDLGFRGLVVTDSLEMGAVADRTAAAAARSPR